VCSVGISLSNEESFSFGNVSESGTQQYYSQDTVEPPLYAPICEEFLDIPPADSLEREFFLGNDKITLPIESWKAVGLVEDGSQPAFLSVEDAEPPLGALDSFNTNDASQVSTKLDEHRRL